jgi:hypothetical protein
MLVSAIEMAMLLSADKIKPANVVARVIKKTCLFNLTFSNQLYHQLMPSRRNYELLVACLSSLGKQTSLQKVWAGAMSAGFGQVERKIKNQR